MSRLFAAPRLALALLPLALTVGCNGSDDDTEFRVTTTTGFCTSCGGGNPTNSPAINDFGVPEIHLGGDPNDANVSLLGILDLEEKLHTLQVIDDEFTVVVQGLGISPNDPGIVLSGAALVGWKILLDTPDGPIDVEITSYGQASSLAKAGPAISTYSLEYQSPIDANERLSICPGGPSASTVVTLIVGETYDRDLKLVQPGRAKWVTLACADEAVFKMKRMNYGPNAHFNNKPLPATVNQRQATLKMITADYCGGGTSYTVQGTPLIWQDTAQTVGPESVQTPNKREAFWNENGVICLDTPRFVDRQEITECSIPLCSEADISTRIWGTITP